MTDPGHEDFGGEARTFPVASNHCGIGCPAFGAETLMAGDVVEGFLYSPGMGVAGRSSKIQRNTIGARSLGLRRQPR
ncbi:MAG: hypothetical protein GY929_11565 [Actinomycetia bacterium]|nr:hypothetical protein [Actinomycetes bacterium]